MIRKITAGASLGALFLVAACGRRDDTAFDTAGATAGALATPPATGYPAAGMTAGATAAADTITKRP